MQNVKVGVFAVLLAAVTARADELSPEAAEGEAIQKRINAALTAIEKKQPGKAIAVMAESVSIEGLPFTSGTCSKNFGSAKRREVAGAERAALVSCLGKQKWFSAAMPFRVEKRDDQWTVWLMLKPHFLPTEVPLVKKEDGTFVIKGIHFPLEDGIEGDSGSIPAPVAGGVVYVDPRPSVPRTGPLNVPPAVVERLRLTGDKAILPDQPTQDAIQKSGRDKIIGAFKMCLDTEGKVASVQTLKPTGYPAYDTKITGGMRAWTYRPYLADGKPTPVCTTLSFIVSKK